LYGAETWTQKKVLKRGTGEEWRRSFGTIVCEMKYYRQQYAITRRKAI
jgi:hypothetical protein